MYEMIHKVDKVGFKMLRFLMGWSERTTRRRLNRLIKDGLVKKQEGCAHCGNTNIIYMETPLKELINWDEFNKKPRKNDE